MGSRQLASLPGPMGHSLRCRDLDRGGSRSLQRSGAHPVGPTLDEKVWQAFNCGRGPSGPR